MATLEIKYKQVPIKAEAYELKLFQALDLLINVNDIYEEGQSDYGILQN